MTWIELSVDCLNETFTVSGSLPEPPQAVRTDAARAVASREGSTAVGRTGMTSYGLTSLWPGRLPCERKRSGLVPSMTVHGLGLADPGPTAAPAP